MNKGIVELHDELKRRYPSNSDMDDRIRKIKKLVP